MIRSEILRAALPFVGLGAGYGLIRYGLFFIHGMKEWPNLLAGAGLIVLAAAVLTGGRRTAWMAALGYAAGFFRGCFLAPMARTPAAAERTIFGSSGRRPTGCSSLAASPWTWGRGGRNGRTCGILEGSWRCWRPILLCSYGRSQLGECWKMRRGWLCRR